MRSEALVAGALLVVAVPAARAAVFYSRDEALRLAFPGASRIETREIFVTPGQRAAIEERGQGPLDSDLVTVYRGYDATTLLGYALIDTRRVRTLPETVLVVLSPEGVVRRAELLAFYEPLEYRPPARWLAKLSGAKAPADARVGVSVDAISGATFTTHASAASVRRALAIYALLLAPAEP